MNTCFDVLDLYTLAARLSPVELRREIREAEMKDTIADTFAGTEYQDNTDCFPWLDYANICREALTWQSKQPKKTTNTPGRIDIETIKNNNDIISVIERYTRLRKAGKNFTGCCPIHQDKHPSLTVYPDSQTWHCYGCNRGGDIFTFIQEIEHTDFRGAAAILQGGM